MVLTIKKISYYETFDEINVDIKIRRCVVKYVPARVDLSSKETGLISDSCLKNYN